MINHEYREDGRYSAEQLFARFALKFGAKVALLHGKMKNQEKNEIIDKFTNGDVDILVSTQVIEVGIDVKDANLMIVYDANAYGLSSLHQLRGRIGRNGEHATCLLVYDSDEEEAIEKLNVLVESDDGFEIAEKDLKLRGPGELTGIKQSGLPDFQYLNMIDDIKIFIVARDDARYMLEHRNDNDFTYMINRCLKEINEEPILKA